MKKPLCWEDEPCDCLKALAVHTNNSVEDWAKLDLEDFGMVLLSCLGCAGVNAGNPGLRRWAKKQAPKVAKEMGYLIVAGRLVKVSELVEKRT
jgi:hypothetical protein